MSSIKVLGVAGSPREGSYNRKLLALAVRMLRDQGVDVDHFDVHEQSVPMFDPDVEAQGVPEVVKDLRARVAAADAVLFSCPEYNAGMTPLMKSIIDWCSRKDPETGVENVWKGKVGALVSASPGAFGGARGMIAMRQTLAHVEVFLIPQFTVVPAAHKAFGEDGTLKNERSMAGLVRTLETLVDVTRKLKA